MTRDASVPTPIGNGVGKPRCLPKPVLNAIMQAAQGGMIVEKQPNSRMCFVCGVDNPIGLHLKFYTDDDGRCIARFLPKPEHQGYPGQLHGGLISTILEEPTQIRVLASVLLV
jgi:acyl-coenzyme A thioesterase PaaI-like protein